MQFLSPWFLLGLLAVAAPVAAHLRRLSVQKRVAFSAVEFLEPKPPRSSRRRWEDLALMLARIAVLAFFCVAFARPYFHAQNPELLQADPPRRISLLVDTSASMRRGELALEARRQAARILEKAGERDEVEVWVFDRSARVVLPVEVWNQTPVADRSALVRDTLESAVKPSWRSGRLDEALRGVAEQQSALPDATPKEAWVVSDFQEGSGLAGLRAIRWPKGMRVHALPVTAPGVDPAQRFALHWMPPDPHTTSADAPWKLQVESDPEFSGEKVNLMIKGASIAEWAAPATPGKVRTTTAPAFAGSWALVGSESAGGEEFGRSVWVARPPERRALVAVQGGGDPGDRAGARYFLERGLLALGASRVELAFAGELSPERDPEVLMWVCLGGVDEAWGSRVRAGVERGGVALVVVSERADGAFPAALAGEEWKLSEGSVDGFAMLGGVERAHPAFAAFRSPQFSDFASVRFWRYRRLELPADTKARVIARFEGGAPAAVEYALGRGSVFVWTSGWRPADSQWVLSSRAVPFLSSCLEWAQGGRQPFVVTVPGETVSLPEGVQRVVDRRGEPLEVRDGRVLFENPGVYAFEPGAGIAVVNLAREESGHAVLPLEKLGALGVPLAGGPAPSAESGEEPTKEAASGLLARELEARQSMWRWVLLGVIFLLGVETIWSGRLSKHKSAIL